MSSKRRALVPRAMEIAELSGLSAIYEPDVAMVWMRRPVGASGTSALELEPFSWTREVDASGVALQPLADRVGKELVDELRELVELHATLFETNVLGVRVALSERPLCPGFHVDKVVGRLVWVVAGEGTEWVDGPLPVGAEREVHHLPPGAAAWFKGTAWPQGCAIVHRSPPAAGRRLVATIDLL